MRGFALLALVTFAGVAQVQASSGAAPQPPSLWMGKMGFLVTDYGPPGAVCATATAALNDTAFQAAVNAAMAAGGGIVWVPAGTCPKAAEVAITANSVWLRGMGRAATHLTGPNTVNGIHVYQSGSDAVFHTRVSDMQIDGFKRDVWIDSGVASTQLKDLYLTGGITPLQINGTRGGKTTQSTYADNLEIEAFSANGIYAFETSELHLNTLVINGNHTASTDILFESGTNAVYGGDWNLLAADYGLLIQDTEKPGGPASRPNQMYLTTVLGDTSNIDGIYIKSGFQISINKAWGSGAGNDTTKQGHATPGQAGIKIGADTDEIELSDLFAIDNAGPGVLLVGPTTGHTRITGGKAISNGSQRAGVYDGVEIQPGVQNCSVVGLAAYNSANQGYGATQRYGIGLDPGPTDHCLITGNQLAGNLTGALADAAIGTSVVIKENGGVDDIVPTIASAATIGVPVNPVFSLTGTTTVTAMTGPAWNGRVASIITPTGAVTFAAGRTIAKTFTSSANVPVTAVFNGGYWYLR